MPQFPLPSSTKHERPRQAEVVSHQREMARGLYLAECSALLASYSAAARGGGSGGGGEGLLASAALGGRGASVAAFKASIDLTPPQTSLDRLSAQVLLLLLLLLLLRTHDARTHARTQTRTHARTHARMLSLLGHRPLAARGA